MLAAVSLALLIAFPGAGSPTRPLDLPPPPIIGMPAEAPPPLDARSWMLWSVERDAELWSGNPDQVRSPASVTKVMTALLVIERGDLDEYTTVSATADLTPIGFIGQPEVVAGETWRVGDLFDFLVVKSGNDVAATLAEYVSGTEEAFVGLMNERAASLGMTSTSFANPHGLDSPGHVSTARDMVILGLAAMEQPRLMEAASLWVITLDPILRDPIPMENTNKLLLRFPGNRGIKTGDTAQAGKVLLSMVDTGHRGMVGIVMGSQDHLAATTELLAYGRGLLDPRDHLLRPGIDAGLLNGLPGWERTRIAATGRLPTGRDRITPPFETPGGRALAEAFAVILPGLLGGTE